MSSVDNKTRRTATTTTWMDNYYKLTEYYKIHHHCNVTKKEDPKLARWVTRQRGERKQYITEERRGLLYTIQFQWDIQQKKNDEENWETNFVKLREYMEKETKPSPHMKLFTLVGITNYSKQLGTWAANQRKLNSKSKLRPDRKAKLESIQFSFGSERNTTTTKICCSVKYEKRWEEMFQRLQSYKEKHGDCCVPYKYKQDRSLALWVSTQRREYNQKSWCGSKRTMQKCRRDRLDAIGFVWDNLPKKGSSGKRNTTKNNISNGSSSINNNYNNDSRKHKSLQESNSNTSKNYTNNTVEQNVIEILARLPNAADEHEDKITYNTYEI